MTTPTNNDIPSNSIQDRLFNSEKLDEVVNSENIQYTDRKGVKRYTLTGLKQLVSNWLTTMSGSEGGSNVGLKQGGTVQNAIKYTTLENLGYSPTIPGSASDALDKFISLGRANEYTTLKLSSGATYTLTRSHVIDFPHSIIGDGANFSQGDQIGTTKFIDGRGSNAEGYLLTIANGSAIKTYGWTWSGFEIVGSRSLNNYGVLISAEGWAFGMERILIRNFGKTGLGLNAVLDGTVNDLFIGACGGKIDGVVYYGLDLYPTGATYVCNLIGFYRLHIEHCRYMINLAGFDLSFTDAHLEIGAPAYDDDYSPCVNIGPIYRPIKWNSSFFTAPGWINLVSKITDQSDPASVIAAIPAFFGTTNESSTVLKGGEYDSKLEFNNCGFSSAKGYDRFVNLPFMPVDIKGCHLANLAMYAPPVVVGPRSKIIDNKMFCKTLTGDTSVFSGSINDKATVAIQGAAGWQTIANNDFYLFNLSPGSLSAVSSSAPASCIIMGNKLVGFTSEISGGGGIYGGQIVGGLNITDGKTSPAAGLQISYNGIISSIGENISLRLPNKYNGAYPVYSADGTSFTIAPSNDTGNAYLGGTAARWTEIRAKTSVISTSDGRFKENQRPLSDREKTAGLEISKLIKGFTFSKTSGLDDSNENKTHFGVIAQDVVGVLDKWINSEGNDEERYGIRYEELICFIIGSQVK